jgi:para-aminobenzoate synthetase / 4-amino-4-deoxychorismate lyase
LSRSTTDETERSFDLLETLRWTPAEGFFLLDRHLQRLHSSARYFGFPCSIDEVHLTLARAVIGARRALRIRLLVDRRGEIRIEQFPLEISTAVVQVRLAAMPIDPADPFLFHKTTYRRQQDRERTSSSDEIVLWNPAREITETSTANIVVDVAGRMVTPPLECGLLAGTMRAELLAAGAVLEKRISIDQLVDAGQFWLINSVRGRRPARLTG